MTHIVCKLINKGLYNLGNLNDGIILNMTHLKYRQRGLKDLKPFKLFHLYKWSWTQLPKALTLHILKPIAE